MDKEISSALKSAFNFLEEAIKAAIEKDAQKINEMIWKASSELEYFLFLLSIMIGEGNMPKIDSKSVPDPKFKGELGPFLVSIQDILAEARELFQKKLYSEAYALARGARNGLLRLQTILDKQRKTSKKR